MKSIIIEGEQEKLRSQREGNRTKSIIIEGEPEFSIIFNALTDHEKIKILKESIREATDEDERKVFQYLLSELTKNP